MAQHDLGDLNTAVFGNHEQQVIGLKKEMSIMKELLIGDGSDTGLVQKVTIMWRIHVWLLVALGTVLGSLITVLIQRVTHV